MGRASNWASIRVDVAHLHLRDTIMILEEGDIHYPWFPKCDMFVSHKALSGRHLATDVFRRGEERKRRRLLEEEAQAGTER